jgi:hypothetical protein
MCILLGSTSLTSNPLARKDGRGIGVDAPMSAGIVSEGAVELAEKQSEMFRGQFD